MKERPILFNGEMVRAILDGRKTQARIVIKSPAKELQKQGIECVAYRNGDTWYDGKLFSMRNCAGVWVDYTESDFLNLCPFGKIGDRFWVRETFAKHEPSECGCSEPCNCVNSRYSYRADYDDGETKWTPSIHMPRSASRITLEITNVRVERLNDISEEDCWAEGIENVSYNPSDIYEIASKINCCVDDAKPIFCHLWNSTGGNWVSNPWVWVIEFKRI